MFGIGEGTDSETIAAMRAEIAQLQAAVHVLVRDALNPACPHTMRRQTAPAPLEPFVTRNVSYATGRETSATRVQYGVGDPNKE